METFLTNLVKQGHLEAVQLTAGGQAKPTQGMYQLGTLNPAISYSTVGKRGRGENPEEEANLEWRWGSRAFSEVGEQAIAEFVASFMANHAIRAAQGDEDRPQEMNARKREKEYESYMKDITRAAGGKLSEVH